MTNNLVRENNGAAKPQGHEEKFTTPAAAVRENPDGYVLELEMPGVNKEGLEISIEDSELSIVGRRTGTKVEGTLVHRESRPNDYRRTFEIDPSIASGKISARISQGVITLTLPKAEEVKPRKIVVS
jgi:HSP20 family protein